jgi:hypothetical protein
MTASFPYRLVLLGLIMLAGLSAPVAARAAGAEIMLAPTRIVMGDADGDAALTVKNVGDAPGDVAIGLQDMKMLESGLVVPLDPGEAPQFSAKAFVHLSPENMKLGPGESRIVHVTLSKPPGLEAGEYRTHIKVRLADKTAPVATNLSIVIPLILRSGVMSLTMGLENPKLSRAADGARSLALTLTRAGNRSSLGDISVTWVPKTGASRVIKVLHGVSLYRPTPRRSVSVPLDETPEDVSLTGGRLDIVYAAPEKDGGAKLAETKLDMP